MNDHCSFAYMTKQPEIIVYSYITAVFLYCSTFALSSFYLHQAGRSVHSAITTVMSKVKQNNPDMFFPLLSASTDSHTITDMRGRMRWTQSVTLRTPHTFVSGRIRSQYYQNLICFPVYILIQYIYF